VAEKFGQTDALADELAYGIPMLHFMHCAPRA
jgi:hypothetical protein